MEQENNFAIIEKQKKTKSFSMSFLFLTVIIFASVFGAVFGFMSSIIAQQIMPKISQKYPFFEKFNQDDNEVIKQKIIQEDSAVIDVVEQKTPAVVSILISKDVPKVQNFFSDPFGFPDPFSDFFGQSEGNKNQGETERQTIGGGSGFIVTADGMIVTNKHVVSDTAAEYTVITTDGKEYKASVLARDPVNDIAIIKIEGSDFPTLNMGDSDALKIGQTVIAIGNSLGEFSNTVSRGIVSGLRRNVVAGSGRGQSERLSGIIQTDAAINPGNSGGPLLDINGDVIGVNVAIVQGAQNIGFALPSNQIKRIVDQVKATGKILTPYLGVRYIPIDKTIQQENNLPFDYGVIVMRGQRQSDFAVIPGSPADKAGLVENDIILEINGVKIDTNNPLADSIAKYNVADEITLKIWRKGSETTVDVILEERK